MITGFDPEKDNDDGYADDADPRLPYSSDLLRKALTALCNALKQQNGEGGDGGGDGDVPDPDDFFGPAPDGHCGPVV